MPGKIIKSEYHTLGEIGQRMECGEKRLRKLISKEGFPAKKLGGQYFTTEKKISEWEERKLCF